MACPCALLLQVLLQSPHNGSSPEGACPNPPDEKKKMNKHDGAWEETTKKKKRKKREVRLSRKHEGRGPGPNETGDANTEGISCWSHAGVMIRLFGLYQFQRISDGPTERPAPTGRLHRNTFHLDQWTLSQREGMCATVTRWCLLETLRRRASSPARCCCFFN